MRYAMTGDRPVDYAIGAQPEFANNRRELAVRYGKGRAVYLPLIREGARPVRTYEEMGGYEGFAHLRLGRNARRLPEAVQRAAVRPLSVRVKGPWTVAAEFLRKSGTNRVFVHLVNYAAKKATAGVSVVLADGADRQARLYLPDDGADSRELKAVRGKGGAVTFRLPAFARYGLVVVDGRAR